MENVHVANKDINFLKSLINAMPYLVSYWGTDERCLLANKPYLEWYDWPEDSAVGCHVRDFLGPVLYKQSEPLIKAALAGIYQNFERTRIARDGSARYLWVTYAPNFDEDGNVLGIFVLATDISDLRHAETDLKLAASVYDNILEGILVTDADGNILSLNRALVGISGYTAEECAGKTPRIFKSDRHPPEFYAAMWQDITARGRWQGEIWNRRKNGEVYLQWLTITRINGSPGEPVRYVGLFNDTSTIQHHNARLAKLAFSDGLTGLPNRVLLSERLERLMARAAREDRLLAILFLDLDGFKSVNDNHGHKVGDDLLKCIADRLGGAIRQSDTVGRLGGDEFLILLDNPSSAGEIANVAGRIIATVNEPVEILDQTLRVGTSIGIAIFRNRGETPDKLIKDADVAMYEAKRRGKNTFRFAGGE